MSELADKVFKMAHDNQAREAVDFIKRCTEEEKVQILSASETIWYLAIHGQAEAVVDIIGTLSPKSQEKVLSGSFVIGDLVHYKQGLKLLKLAEKLPVPVQQKLFGQERVKDSFIDAGLKKEFENFAKNWKTEPVAPDTRNGAQSPGIAANPGRLIL